MATLSHKYVRIRNHNSNFDMDAEELIQSLESRFKMDIKSLPNWKEFIKDINKLKTDYKTKLENAEQRRVAIIRKLYTQYYRLSPFELTDYLIRTASLWKTQKLPNISVKISSTETIMPVPAQSMKSMVSDEAVSSTIAHPNTEVIQSKDQTDITPKTDNEIKSNSSCHLPTIILTNQHRIISPLKSPFSLMDLKYGTRIEDDLTKSVVDEGIILRYETKSLKCYPNTLLITDDSSRKQTMKFTIKNCVLEHIYVQFKRLSDSSYFDNIEIIPATPFKLNPGLTKTYKCIFTLRENFSGLSIVSSLYFRAGRNVLFTSEEKVLRIPILSQFKDTYSVNVTETVYIPPVYQWEVKAPFKYPRGLLIIDVKNNSSYDVYIRKKDVDLTKGYNDDLDSLRAKNSDTGSLEQEATNFDNSEFLKSKILSSPKMTDTFIDDLPSSVDIVMIILEDLVSTVLQPFIFKNTYLRLAPKSKRINIVYFTKAEHIGYHQSYFDLIFTKPDNHNIVFVETVKVFAEILPHPIVIVPNILDMTESPVTFGYCKGNFTISNTNKTFSTTIKIKANVKTKKLFKITPEKVLIAPKSKAVFEIRMCVDYNNEDSKNIEEYAYFILKICCTENNIVFRNAPSLFYEVIAPCDPNFNRYLTNNIINM